ncbi:MAG: dienelactone hydrolase family protein [Planctomycetota bacterium]
MRIVSTLLLLASLASAGIVSKTVEYKDGDTVLAGEVVRDDTWTGKRPAVLVVHQWKGITDHERTFAKRLVGLGYVAFVCDIYGKGVRPKNAQEARATAGLYRGAKEKVELFRRRLDAALRTMRAHASIDGARIGAIGFCFGGGGVLELARAGADVKGVVSFHGGLTTPLPATAVKAKVLVCHGADDPLVPDEHVVAFMQEMRKAKADWRLIAYGGAVHSFTQPSANRKGVAEYHEPSAKRSWQDMKRFLADALGTS